jgi:hypothetical protein
MAPDVIRHLVLSKERVTRYGGSLGPSWTGPERRVISRPPLDLAPAAPAIATPRENQRAQVRAQVAVACISDGCAGGGIDAV